MMVTSLVSHRAPPRIFRGDQSLSNRGRNLNIAHAYSH